MHELSLARALLDEADRIRQAHSARRVVAVQVEVGELSGVEPELLRSALNLLTQSGQEAPVAIEIQSIPLEARCPECGWEGGIVRFNFRCPACTDTRLTVLRGEGLILRNLTLETDMTETVHE
jgi:hydrogenase nickel incorporation protein HypA/HybF